MEGIDLSGIHDSTSKIHGNLRLPLFLSVNRRIIKYMTMTVKSLFSNDRLSFFVLAAISAAALAAAFISQYAYGLQPCILCIYQRWPFVAAIGLCLLGIYLGRAKPGMGKAIMALTGLTFLTNAGIAFYHTGVERQWWASFLEGCTVPQIEGNITDVLAKLAQTPVVRCDEIPWTDPVLGLSMANYNVGLCAALAAAAFYACALMRRA